MASQGSGEVVVEERPSIYLTTVHSGTSPPGQDHLACLQLHGGRVQCWLHGMGEIVGLEALSTLPPQSQSQSQAQPHRLARQISNTPNKPSKQTKQNQAKSC